MSDPTPSNLRSITASLVHISPTQQAISYKPSRFIAHSSTADGSTVIYNSLTGHHCAIPRQHKDAIKRLLSRIGSAEPLGPLGDYLVQHHYLVKSDTDEKAAFDIRYGNEHYRQDRLELILLSSEDCNFRCVYCSQEFKRGSMLPAVRKGTLELIRNRISRLSELNISWFGGEPLMGWDAIEELAPEIQRLAREHETRLTSSITTNGYLLTPERSKLLLEWDVRDYQITLDGTEEEHDAHRPLKDGGSTFSTILANLITLQEQDTYFSVALRVNADKDNSSRLRPLFDILAHQFGSDERFKMRFRPIGKWGGPNDEALTTFCGLDEEHSTLVQLHAESRVAGMHVESLAEDLRPSQVCYAARPYSFIIGSDGKLMKCTVVLDTLESNVVGKLDESGRLDLNESRFVSWVKPHYASDSTCQKCFFLPSCQGASCPLPRFVGERPCPPAKTHIQRTLRDIHTLEQDPERLIKGWSAV